MDENIKVISCTALGAFGVKRAAYAVGVFDGVHLGHQMILSNLIRLAGQCGAEPVAVTFAPHPRALLTPQNPPKLLMPLSERIRKIHCCGIRFVVVMPFTRQLAVKSPEEFIQQSFMIENIQTAAITVGENWRFGAQGRGDGVFLQDFAQKHDFIFEAVPMVALDGKIICSSLIRNLIAGGDLDEAAKMLGRRYSIFGAVEHGYGQAGGELACPTANLTVECGILPPCGVYAAVAEVEKRRYRCAVNIGKSPTFKRHDGTPVRVEAHLLDFSGSLYGESLELTLLKYLREERTFGSVEELKRQIGSDIKAIRNICCEIE